MGYTAICGIPYALFLGLNFIPLGMIIAIGVDAKPKDRHMAPICLLVTYVAHVSAIAAAGVSIAAWCEGCKNDSKRKDGDFSVGGPVVVAAGTGQEVLLSGGYVYGGIGTGAVSGAGYGGNEAAVGAGYGGNEAVVGAGYGGAQAVVGTGYGGAQAVVGTGYDGAQAVVVGAGYGGNEAVVGTSYGGNEAVLGTDYSGTQAALVGGSA